MKNDNVPGGSFDRSKLSSYNLFADLLDCHVEGDHIVICLGKKNQPHLSAALLRREFEGWQVCLHFRKTRRIWNE